MNEMAIPEVIKTYLHRLIRFCSDYKPDGLPDAGDLYFQEYSLQDIYMPLRIYGGQEMEEQVTEVDQMLDAENLDALLTAIDDSMKVLKRVSAGDSAYQEPKLQASEKPKVEISDRSQTNRMDQSLDLETDLKPSDDKELDEEAVAPESVSLDDLLMDIDTSLMVLESEGSHKEDSGPDEDLLEFETEDLLGELDRELMRLESGGVKFVENERLVLDAGSQDANAAMNRSGQTTAGEHDNTRNDGKRSDGEEQNPFYHDKLMNPEQIPSSRSLILAGPGYGKTTLTKRIALAYAKNEREFLKQNFLREGLFPVLLLCRSLDDRKSQSFEAQLTTMLENSYFGGLKEGGVLQATLIEVIKDLAREGRLLLIVDGFDEVYSAEAQRQFGQDLVGFMQSYPLTHLMLSSRKDTPVDLNGGNVADEEEQDKRNESAFLSTLDPIEGLVKKEIKPLSESEITEFVYRWFKAIYPLDQSKERDAKQIIDQIHSNQYRYLHKANMVQVPLHLTNILLLSRNNGKIPASKGDLYEKYISQAINWKPANLYEPEDLWMVVSFAALSMMKRGLTSVRHDDLIEILDEALEYFEGFIAWSKSTEELIFVLESVACLIQKAAMTGGQPVYQFAHNQFKEYLAATALVRGYVDGEEATLSKTNRVLAYMGKNRWSEVVSFGIRMLDDEELIGELVKRVKEKKETGKSSFSEKNLLFEIVTSFGFIVPAMRKTILELIFKTGITAPQMRMMEDFLQDPKSKYFSRFVEKNFQESMEAGEKGYGLVRGALEIYRQSDPMKAAVERFINGQSEVDVLCGSYMLNVIAWCKTDKIGKVADRKEKSEFIFDLTEDQMILGESFKKALERHLIHEEGPNWRIYAEHLSDLMHAEMIKDPESLFTQDLYTKVAAVGKQYSKITLRLLSVFPINDKTLEFASLVDMSEVREILLKVYKEMKGERAREERVLFFAACLMAGAWDSAESITRAYDELKKILDNEKPTGNSALRIIRLEKEMRRLGYDREFVNAWYPDPYSTKKGEKAAFISEGLGYYQIEKFGEAKEAFLAAFNPDHFFSPANNYLAMMLRRGEIAKLKHMGQSYTVPKLIQSGVDQGDVFSLINMALFQSSVYEGGDITGGDALIRLIPSEDEEGIEEAKRWWTHMARLNDLEGQVVLYWLLKHGLVERSSVGNLRTLEVMFHRNNIHI